MFQLFYCSMFFKPLTDGYDGMCHSISLYVTLCSVSVTLLPRNSMSSLRYPPPSSSCQRVPRNNIRSLEYCGFFFWISSSRFLKKSKTVDSGKFYLPAFLVSLFWNPKERWVFGGFWGPRQKNSWRQETDPEPQILFGIERR